MAGKVADKDRLLVEVTELERRIQELRGRGEVGRAPGCRGNGGEGGRLQ